MQMRKITLLLVAQILMLSWVFAQTQTVTGKVTDDKGVAIAGASVLERGTKNGTSTGVNGTFTLNIKQGAVLIIQGVGLENKTIRAVDGMVVKMTSSTSNLNEVVVTALGVKRQPKQLGYSATTISSKDINQVSVNNAVMGLSGKVSGVDIRLADNSVNPNIKINFRGSRSINGDNTALIIVDGAIVPQEYMANLNPEDIESSTILKGSGAAAIYGKDASNGVLIITTKKGSGGKKGLTVNYKNSTLFTQVSYMPNLQTEYSPYGGEPNYIDQLTGSPLPVPFENQNFGPAYNSKDFPFTVIAIGGPDSTGKILYGPYKAYANGRKDFFQTGVNEQNNLSLSGANSWGSFYASGENDANNGIVYKDKSNRNSGRFNGTAKFGSFNIVGGVSYSSFHVNRTGPAYWGPGQYRPVYWNVINQAPNIDLATVKDISNYFNSPDGYINAYYGNPWFGVYHSRNIEDHKTFTSNLQVEYKINNWLSVGYRGNYNKTNVDAPSHIDSYQFDSTSMSDPWSAGNIPSANKGGFPYQYEDIKYDYSDFNNDAMLTFKKKANNLDFTLIAGVNYRERKSHGYWYSNQTGSLAVPNGITKVNNTDGSAYANYNYSANSQGAYADLLVGYDGWAYLHGSYRNDWLSIMFPSTRSFSYGALDASAILSDKFASLKEHGISYLKVRAGYSITGNVSLPSTLTLGNLANQTYGLSMPTYGAYYIYPTVGTGSGFPFNNLNGYSLSYSSVQPGLKPEKDAGFEAGFEIGLLKDRIRFEATYFTVAATNQTLSKTVSGVTGNSSILQNTGKIEDNGIELDLRLTPLLKLGKFSWNAGVNFSYLNNYVAYLTPGNTDKNNPEIFTLLSAATYNVDAVTGKDLYSLYVSDWNRDAQGHVIVDATTGLPTTATDKVYAGNTDPKYLLGLNSNFNYKRFSLSAVFEYRGGNKIINTVGQALDFSGISSSSAVNRSHFIIPGSVNIVNGQSVPNTTPTSDLPYQWWSTVYNSIGAPYVVSGAFWKMREVSLSYDIPVKIFGSQHLIKRLLFSLVGQNLFMWRPKTNQWTDPEFSSSINSSQNATGAVNEYLTPPTRSFGFSLNATF